MANLFYAANYRTYLQEWILERPHRGHGLNSKLARSARCQPAYFSRILKGTADLSPEQALAIQPLLGHSSEETLFFMTLLERDRTSDPRLKAFHNKKLDTARAARTDLRTRLRETRSLTSEHQFTYYGSAHFAAIHACISVPELQTIPALRQFLRLSTERITEVLGFLARAGLAVKKDGRWKVGLNRLHLDRDSDLISHHHRNWRLEALRSLDRAKRVQDSRDLHYSAVVSLSKEDAAKLKEHWAQAVEKFSQTVAPSSDETVYAVTLDYFSLE